MALEFAQKILLFTDGACSGNPGKGGYGGIIVFPEGRVEEFGGGNLSTTNNRMEMMAVIEGLKRLNQTEGDVWVLTDSTYTIRGITQWIWSWKKKAWKTTEGKDVGNRDLWLKLDDFVRERKRLGELEWKYVRGHQGIPANERCDEIAVKFSQKKYVPLFSGKLLEYPVAVHDLPDDFSLPPMKANKEKVSAYSYLSYVNGVLERHADWSSCEAKVKGRSGAKFKKTTSADNEREVVKNWGLDPAKLEDL